MCFQIRPWIIRLASMDARWVKDQLVKAGLSGADFAREIGRDRTVASRILNGHQPIRPDQARKLAKMLGCDIQEVMVRAGILHLEDVPTTLSHRVGESEAALFALAEEASKHLSAVAKSLGADRPGVDVWQVSSSSMQLDGYLPGDLMLVDNRPSMRLRAGDAVVAEVCDEQTGSPQIVFRRYEPPALLCRSALAPKESTLFLGGRNLTVKGRVIASCRFN